MEPTTIEALTIPGYQIQGKIATGGFAAIFKAVDMETFQVVAIKMLYPEKAKNPAYINRFTTESQLLLTIRSPWIVKGLKRGSAEGLPYVVTEYVPCIPLSHLIQQNGTLIPPICRRVMIDAAKAVGVLSEMGFVHCDLKPDNLLVTAHDQVKLCDLGLAEPTGNQSREMSDTTAGTPEFMSPEQALGRLDLDFRADVYSMGVILYQMVFGRLPFTGKREDVLIAQVREQPLIDDVTFHIPSWVKAVLPRMLAKDRERRFRTPAELLWELENAP
jgi:serine/threonine-protein kinase